MLSEESQQIARANTGHHLHLTTLWKDGCIRPCIKICPFCFPPVLPLRKSMIGHKLVDRYLFSPHTFKKYKLVSISCCFTITTGYFFYTFLKRNKLKGLTLKAKWMCTVYEEFPSNDIYSYKMTYRFKMKTNYNTLISSDVGPCLTKWNTFTDFGSAS